MNIEIIKQSKERRETKLLDQICDYSNLSPLEFLTTITDINTDQVIVRMFDTLINILTLKELKQIEFEKYSEQVALFTNHDRNTLFKRTYLFFNG